MTAPAPIKLICAWHGGVISDGAEPASHGICEACLKRYFGIELDDEKETP